jgi:hypothetical protein
MKHFKLLMVFIAFSLMLFISCKKDTDTSVIPKKSQTQGKSSARLSALSAERLAKLRASLPDGFEEKLKQRSELLSKTHPQYREMVLKALAVEPTPCDDNTVLFQWLIQSLDDWPPEAFIGAAITAMFDLPLLDALYFNNSSDNQYFGVNGEYTHVMNKTFKDLKRFWNIQSDDIVLAGMHGSMMLDKDKVIRVYTTEFGFSPALAAEIADYVLVLLNTFPEYKNGDHPIFTFNAFALEGFDLPSYGQVADKIVMGDGLLEAYTAIGYGDVAPQTILAHEYGHHIQFQLGLFTDEFSAEATRRTELMADAYSAYYLSHARGASMQWKRVQQFLQVSFNSGDCGFASPAHHGTPTQRMAASEWGYTLANNAQKQGHILTAQQFAVLFDAALPELVLF